MTESLITKGRRNGWETWFPESWGTDIDRLNSEMQRIVDAAQLDAMPFDMTNVLEYLVSLGPNRRYEMRYSDLPPFVPPYSPVWVEMPNMGDDWLFWKTLGPKYQRLGALTFTLDAGPSGDEDGELQRDIRRFEFVGPLQDAIADRIRFICKTYIFVDVGVPTVVGPLLEWVWALDDTGVGCRRTDKDAAAVGGRLLMHDWRQLDPKVQQDILYLAGRDVLVPLLFMFSLCHCKNVSIVDAPDTRSRQVKRADQRNGTPHVTIKTLEIGRMRDALANEGHVAKNGIRRALHICRGHFSEYTPDKPLFGKYTGRFWIPQHVRGTSDAGVVVKDYRVTAPDQGAAA